MGLICVANLVRQGRGVGRINWIVSELRRIEGETGADGPFHLIR